jgi:rhodanese-related sulfurtransferase
MTDRIPALTVEEAAARIDDGSAWIPMGELSERQGELPEGTPLVVACHSGGRSARVTQALVAAGYDASNLVGGLVAWSESGRPLVAGGGGTGSV